MKEKIEDKLEEIINKYQIHTSIGIKETIDVCDEWDMKTMGVAINELSTLIQAERKEAIEGFVRWCRKKDRLDSGRSFRTYWTVFGIEKEAEEYLQSLDKGDTDENR